MPLLAVIHRRARLEFRISGFRFLRLIGCTGEGTKVDGGEGLGMPELQRAAMVVVCGQGSEAAEHRRPCARDI